MQPCYICGRPIPKREVGRLKEWARPTAICKKCDAKLAGSSASICRKIKAYAPRCEKDKEESND